MKDIPVGLITCPYCGQVMSREFKLMTQEVHHFYECLHCGSRGPVVINYTEKYDAEAKRLCAKLSNERVRE